MSLLRTDAELALDEVTEQCKLAVHHYRLLQHGDLDSQLRRLFADLEERHRAYILPLEQAARCQGNLPSAPDADREALEHLLVRLKAALPGDERGRLLESCEKVEQELGQTIRAALEHPLPESLLDLLRHMDQSVAAAHSSLAALHQS
ncbi:MAG: hypothetical protein IH614_10895 [Desulfuromonadales bacterium]|nr:hypothetical protein [Desulfuromonadales bacterium]